MPLAWAPCWVQKRCNNTNQPSVEFYFLFRFVTVVHPICTIVICGNSLDLFLNWSSCWIQESASAITKYSLTALRTAHTWIHFRCSSHRQQWRRLLTQLLPYRLQPSDSMQMLLRRTAGNVNNYLTIPSHHTISSRGVWQVNNHLHLRIRVGGESIHSYYNRNSKLLAVLDMGLFWCQEPPFYIKVSYHKIRTTLF